MVAHNFTLAVLDFGQKSFTARRALFGGNIFKIQLYKFYKV